ncbi:ATP-binding protein [Pacificibacter marinus]|uniref:ATP-binding protein n=1 Tax=Pacificibacter marinus TaxID=658057 RepID=UPI001C075056|nr:ATP-binding protein [Pacificibacter marinus]MBU2868199.1 HAMP domain-containing protein [Pacificibacter marinus]
MTFVRNSLAIRIFLAIAATSIVIVAIMAVLVALSMRDGFARYILRSELARFDALEQALVLSHASNDQGWPELTATPKAWNDFVRLYISPPDLPTGPPPDHPFESLGFEGLMFGGPPPGGPKGGPEGDGTFKIGDRLTLLGPDGEWIAGSTNSSGLFERRAICSDTLCADQNVLGYLGLSAPLLAKTPSDTFFLRGQYASLALSALIAILVSAGAAIIVARYVLTPIRQLESGAKTMALGDYSTRIDLKRTDELGQLIDHYNVLAATLEKTDKAEREWISNTSHELQTPLATLQAQIEAVQDGIRKPDAETLSQMHAATMRLSRLVEDVKILSHSREKGLTTAFHREDLCKIARSCAAVARPQMYDKGLTLTVDMPDTMPIVCDRLRIGQVIDNLLQNAVRYTNAPGSVRLCVQSEGDVVHLSVEDTPPAPRNEDLPKLFDRFFRAESSRSRAHGGSGLGLSVCKAIVDSHSGTITAGLSMKGGLCITVTLPKATP